MAETGRNGTFFLSIVSRQDVRPGVWDPYYYRTTEALRTLGEFVRAEKLGRRKHGVCAHRPIAYAHIPRGPYLSFALEPNGVPGKVFGPCAGEQEVLFGTMRAYLGNVIVTPAASWLGMENPLAFEVGSEFLRVVPEDGLVFFWGTYLRSPVFLRGLPLGHGGTRPRLSSDSLLAAPVQVPPLDERAATDKALQTLATAEWRNYVRLHHIVRQMSSGAGPEANDDCGP